MMLGSVPFPKGSELFPVSLSIILVSQVGAFSDRNPKIRRWHTDYGYIKKVAIVRMEMYRRIIAVIQQTFKKEEYHYFRDGYKKATRR